MNFRAYTYQKNGETVENNNLYGLLYIGYRFAPPKVVKNTYDKVKKIQFYKLKGLLSIFALEKFRKEQNKSKNIMSLIKSISGIRGTIGGKVNDNLTPLDVVKFASTFGTQASK